MKAFELQELRQGITTGLSAAAAAEAATIALFSGNTVQQVQVTARTGEQFIIPISQTNWENDWVRSGVVKDAGDDPDVTDGLTVFTAVRRTANHGIDIDGGEGIGRVTKPGLKAAVGQAAINPVPREMITQAIQAVCSRYGYTGGIQAVVSIPGGEQVAKRTMNARLGVIGGLSILGTTGIVRPMSNQALIDTIKAEIDVQIASGRQQLLMMPGNYGRDFAQQVLGLGTAEAIRFANFIGEALAHACRKGVTSITLIGHAGKLVKLAGGIMNTHSSVADCRLEIIAAHAALMGARQQTIQQIMNAVSSEAAIDILIAAGLNDAVWQSIKTKIDFHLEAWTAGLINLEYYVFTQEHGVLIHSQLYKQDELNGKPEEQIYRPDDG